MIHSQEYNLLSRWQTRHENITGDLMKILIILYGMMTPIHEHEHIWAEMVKCTEEHFEKYGIIYGDEVQIPMKIDLIQIHQKKVK